MMVSDPIADFLTRIRNAILAKHESTDIPASKLKWRVAEILKEEGYIANLELVEDGLRKTIRIFLKYDAGERSALQGLKRISKPGRRVYVPVDQLPRVLDGLGVAILSTSRGVLPDRECRQRNVGGEVLCHLW